jgi:hypothetical protein
MLTALPVGPLVFQQTHFHSLIRKAVQRGKCGKQLMAVQAKFALDALTAF